MTESGHNLAERVRDFVHRIENLEETRREIGGEIRGIFAEAKSEGFDRLVLREILRLRRMDKQARLAFEESVDELRRYCELG